MGDSQQLTAGAHPATRLIPAPSPEDYASIRWSIREIGQQQPIVLFKGVILDGRARYAACVELGITPIYTTWEGADPVGYVVAANLHRRHLLTGQRAIIAARMPRLAHGGKRGKSQISDLLPGATREARAAIAGVSVKTVEHAERLVDHGTEELIARVEAGFITVDVAAKVSNFTPERQAFIAAADTESKARTLVKQATRADRERAMAERTEAAAAELADSERRYAVILADPPWRFEPWSPTGMDRAADNHYPTVTVDKLKAMTVPKAPTSILFLWATAPMLLEALAVMAAWGFAYKTHLVWAKDKVGTGYWARSRHELLLIGTRGDVPAPAMGLQPESVIEAPRGEHSVKPDEFRVIIEAMFPNCPRLEMFARTPREGWDSWGNEIDPPADSAS
jgi:N6-adenosine-specific RNA methylase IME4